MVDPSASPGLIVAAIIDLASHPGTCEHDLRRYYWTGRAATAGLNPYDAGVLSKLAGAQLFWMGWKAKHEHCGHIQFHSDETGKEQPKHAGFDVVHRRSSIHPIYALVDVAYFTMLSLRGEQVSTSVEGFVHAHNGHPSVAQRAVGSLKDVLVAMAYYESGALRWLPAAGAHLTASKIVPDIISRNRRF